MVFHAQLEAGAGFADPVASSQSVFRSVMNALARPGSIETISGVANLPPPLMPATAAIALTLFDHDTPIWMDEALSAEPRTASWLRFQSGAPLTKDASCAAFALIHHSSVLPDFERFALGTPEYPDRSTTLIVQTDTLTDGDKLVLRGPGIRDMSVLRAGALPPNFVACMQANRALFPRGIDLVLVCGNDFVALPRSTHIDSGKA